MEKQTQELPEKAVQFCEDCPTADNEFGKVYCPSCAQTQRNKLDGFLRETREAFEIAPGEWVQKTHGWA